MKLTNREIFEARPALQELIRYKLPVKSSWQVAKLTNKINVALTDIDVVRKGLIQNYGEPNEKGGLAVPPGSDKADKFMVDFNELMEQEVELVIGKVILPEKVSSTCDKCSHNMDKPLEIEPWILSALVKFLDVKE